MPPSAATTPSFTSRVRVAGLRVRVGFEPPADAAEVHDVEPLHRRVVEPQEGDLLAVRAPPVRPAVAVEDLLLVDPVALAVEDVAAAVGRELLLLGLLDIDGEEVAAADERDPLAVGREA